MKIDREALIEKRNNCIAALDSNKVCETCLHERCDVNYLPCNDCNN